MKEYFIEVMGINGTCDTCNFSANNPIEAFEQAVTEGELEVPHGQELEIVATSYDTRLVIKFRAERY